jgi:hypothetical protein
MSKARRGCGVKRHQIFLVTIHECLVFNVLKLMFHRDCLTSQGMITLAPPVIQRSRNGKK